MTKPDRLSPHPTAAAARLPWWAWLCVLVALLGAPWLGAVHGTLHARSAASGPATVLSSAAVATASLSGHAQDVGLRRLFGHHSHEGDCRIYDQLSHADGLHLTAAMPPVVLPPVAVMAWHAGECLRRWATLFDARGPPVLA